jgi:DNA invertase Pin-like site-specific DNA recombinase
LTQIAIFVRVSSKNQDYERQLSDLTAYAVKHNFQIVQKIEEVVSASKTKAEHRKAIKDLLELAASGKVRKILVTEISRLGRKPIEFLKIVEYCLLLSLSPV